MEVLYGLHPVGEAVRSGSRVLDYVIVARERRDERLEGLVELCRSAGIRVSLEPRDQLTRLAKTDAHQGILAMVESRKLLVLEDLLDPGTTGEPLFLLALDGVEDPHNLGAILRTCDAAGVNGVLLPERRAAPLNATVAKTSAGASEYVRIAQVTNIVRSLERAKQRNFWVVGLDERGTVDYSDFDFRMNVVLVLGREGTGMHDLVKRTCDHLLRIPMAGSVSSLNVSVAGAVVMYEAMRQRRQSVEGNTTEPVAKKRKGLGS